MKFIRCFCVRSKFVFENAGFRYMEFKVWAGAIRAVVLSLQRIEIEAGVAVENIAVIYGAGKYGYGFLLGCRIKRVLYQTHISKLGWFGYVSQRKF
jgi:hypothetical protein